MSAGGQQSNPQNTLKVRKTSENNFISDHMTPSLLIIEYYYHVVHIFKCIRTEHSLDLHVINALHISTSV